MPATRQNAPKEITSKTPKAKAKAEGMETIGFRVSPREKKAIVRGAYDQGQSVSDYLRCLHRHNVSNLALSKRMELLFEALELARLETLERLDELETRLAREIIVRPEDLAQKIVDEISRISQARAKKE